MTEESEPRPAEPMAEVEGDQQVATLVRSDEAEPDAVPAEGDALEAIPETVAIDPDPSESDPDHDADLGSEPMGPVAFVGLLCALACSVFILVQLRPDLLVADTTPSGGDMGAHVWGPAFLRDELLSQGRLTGWTPDWYAGFPAYQFYMVVPALAIILLNAGLTPIIGIPLGLGVLLAAGVAAARRATWRVPIIVVGVVGALALIPMPYGIAFKLISVSGLVFFPLAAGGLGRLSGAREPIPAFAAFGATVFLFDTNFNIYGGNIASTLAGEFAFSIGLCLSLLAIGVAMRGMDRAADLRPSHRGVAAVVIALVALSHVIPLFFSLLGFALVMLLDQRVPRSWVLAIAIVFGLAPLALGDTVPMTTYLITVGAVVAISAAMIVADPRVRRRFVWLASTGVVAALLSLFWLLPFYLRSDYFNDMGWERKNEISPLLLTTPMKVALPLAALGALLAWFNRDRLGMMFSIMAVVFAMSVANLGEGKLWNARLLPFFYLSVYVLAAIGIALVVRQGATMISQRLERPDPFTLAASTAVAVVGTLIVLAIPLRAMPGGSYNADGVYTWMGLRSHAQSFIPSWTAWNYSGYEEKPSYLEYRTVVDTMDQLGQDNGCGRAMWEYDSGLDRYGTPMALMLLPHWTDGCIGSMEGLYFESSATTPFHFLNQSTLSLNPSRAQRDLPYSGFDVDTGLEQLSTMGVRYYMAQTDEAIAAARANDSVVEVAESQPFVIFEMVDHSMVEALDTVPVVASGPPSEQDPELVDRFDLGWLSQAIAYYGDPAGFDALPAENGPDDWERVGVLLPQDGEPIASPATVSAIEVGTDSIDFTVDEPGTPILVKTSYFPNWKVEGAEGPFRAGPNLMVVVPTDNDVSLSYGYTWVEYVAYLATFVGILGLVALVRSDHRRREVPTTLSA